MIATPFKAANVRLTAPQGREGEVEVLLAWTDGTMYVSCWRLTWKERLSALLFGTAWLGVLGAAHPPVSIEVRRSPFKDAG